jgi:putative membrane protein
MSRSHLVAAVSMAALLGAGACSKPATTAATDAAADAATTVAATAPATDTEANIKQAQDFVNAAGQAGLAEIETSKLALAHSTNPDVKAFAQMMIDDHTKAGEALKAAAAAAALAPPSDTLDETHTRLVNTLSGDLAPDKTGDNFDANYMHMQVEAHNDAVKLFDDYGKNGKVPQVQTFAEATLPTLQMHKSKAESVADSASKVKPS